MIRVDLYSINQGDGSKTLEARNVTLASCFPDDPQEIPALEARLNEFGVAMYGGGAAPLFKLRLLEPRTLRTYYGWRRTLRRECPSVVFEGNKRSCKAFGFWLDVKRPVGEWDGLKGTIEYPIGPGGAV